jgi:hypothetical protein
MADDQLLLRVLDNPKPGAARLPHPPATNTVSTPPITISFFATLLWRMYLEDIFSCTIPSLSLVDLQQKWGHHDIHVILGLILTSTYLWVKLPRTASPKAPSRSVRIKHTPYSARDRDSHLLDDGTYLWSRHSGSGSWLSILGAEQDRDGPDC